MGGWVNGGDTSQTCHRKCLTVSEGNIDAWRMCVCESVIYASHTLDYRWRSSIGSNGRGMGVILQPRGAVQLHTGIVLGASVLPPNTCTHTHTHQTSSTQHASTRQDKLHNQDRHPYDPVQETSSRYFSTRLHTLSTAKAHLLGWV